jgi:glycosyltransferase involved in cell wall biosynthesis
MVNDVAGVGLAETAILREAGYDVQFFELPTLGASWPPLAKAVAMPVRLAGYLPIIAKLRRGHYDFLHIHFITQGVVALAVGKPYFIHVHGSDLHLNFQSRLKKAISLKVLRHSRAIFYVTPNLSRYLLGFEDKAHLIGNPIDTVAFRARRTPSAISDALIFARLESVKGADRIFAHIEDLTRIVKVTAIAWGPWAREYRKRFGEMVRFIDTVPHAEVPSLLQAFDLVIGQMHQGILSLSELEALAMGRIVITALDECLYQSDPPPIVRVAGGDGIIDAVRRLIANPDEVIRLSQAGPPWVEKHHGSKTHLRNLTRAYSGR